MDLFLKTETQSEMETALKAAGLVVERNMAEGLMALVPIKGVAIQWFEGLPAVYENDIMIKPEELGWFVNLRSSISLTEQQIASLPVINPAPKSPYCVFA